MNRHDLILINQTYRLTFDRQDFNKVKDAIARFVREENRREAAIVAAFDYTLVQGSVKVIQLTGILYCWHILMRPHYRQRFSSLVSLTTKHQLMTLLNTFMPYRRQVNPGVVVVVMHNTMIQ
jgi:hypothetical protein